MTPVMVTGWMVPASRSGRDGDASEIRRGAGAKAIAVTLFEQDGFGVQPMWRW